MPDIQPRNAELEKLMETLNAATLRAEEARDLAWAIKWLTHSNSEISFANDLEDRAMSLLTILERECDQLYKLVAD